MASNSAQVSAVYQRCTPVEHITTRPDAYVGSVLPETRSEWVFEAGRISLKEIEVVPGLFKIVDEILVNAIDQSKLDASLTSIKITVDAEAGTICITNTGNGIPVVQHDDYGIYIPELIFGNLLTSSNYDDSQARTTGGRNGYGVKLTNVFSTTFSIETLDLERGLKYTQTWNDNMSKCSKAKVTRPRKAPKHGYVRISFTPDLAKFSLPALDENFVSLIHRRSYDACACTGPDVGVFFNAAKLPCKSFQGYCDLVIGKKSECPRATSGNERWEVCVAPADSFSCLSFVNGVHTDLGGTHTTSLSTSFRWKWRVTSADGRWQRVGFSYRMWAASMYT
jgi:DNA topoisomerase-2